MLLEGRPIVEKSGKIIGHRARFGGIHPSVMGFWREFGEMLPNNSAMTLKNLVHGETVERLFDGTNILPPRKAALQNPLTHKPLEAREAACSEDWRFRRT